ncbi:hypothetical protein [Barnesiella intestinihominis]|uniref:hypothetical protein n=1 Tax=Barnesiella intestinihominis TaxID=487174 RepID=UPI00241E78A3|nr:hypothetical protein [Barnesiella intestinihominis]
MHVIAGCNIMYNQGLTFPPVYSYLYEMQPLVTYTVVGFKYIFPFLTCEQIYCLLSAICGALFIVESVNFVYRITSFRKIFILLSLFLIPESFAISMYPNSAIFAAVFFVCALNRLLDGKFYVAMVLMVIAPLYRIDILIVYPVVFFISKEECKREYNEVGIFSCSHTSICDDWILGAAGKPFNRIDRL